MRVLLMNLYYPPDTSATAKMAETIAHALSQSHEVTVLCGRPSYDPTERRRWRLWQVEQTGNIRIVRVGSTDFPRFNMKKRVLNYLSYVALAVPRALFVECDVVLAMTDPPFQGIVGAFCAVLKSKPYVYNIRDMYPDMAVGGAIVAPGRIARIWERMHRWALRQASCVIVLGEDMKSRIVHKGVSPERVAIVRDGAEIPPPSAVAALDQEVVSAIRGNDSFVVLHAGNLGFYGAWQTLVAAARQLEGSGIAFVFVGDGAQRDEIQRAASGLTNVRFLGFFPAGKIPSVLAAADAHLITIKRCLEGVVVPSKLYGILAAGKPVLAVAPAEADVVTLGVRDGFGVGADPDRPGEVAETIRALRNDPARVHAMGVAALAAAPKFERNNELARFVATLEQTLKTSGRRR